MSERKHQRSAPVGKKTTLATRFNLLVVAIYLGSLLVAAPATYVLARSQAYDAASQELRLLVNMVKAVRGYVSGDVRPALLEAKLFHAPALSGVVATGLIGRRFVESEPGYYIKIASDNPLNPANRAVPLELDLIRRYRADASLQELQVQGELGGRTYLVSASPSVNKPGCLTCHGQPADAPEPIKAAYGTSSGYNYGADGDVVGVNIVGVPAGHIEAIALERSLSVMGLITAIFTIFLIAANIMIKRTVIRPLTELTTVAEAVSKGDLNAKIQADRNDEIGALAHALELMRRSVVTMLRQSR